MFDSSQVMLVGCKLGTKLRNYKFRSELAAKWAVFFDACGVDWDYELESFDLGNGLFYHPAFLLYGVEGRCYGDLYVDVKDRLTDEDARKIVLFSGYDENDLNRPMKNRILVVGDIPDVGCINGCVHSIVTVCYEGKKPFSFNFQLIDGDFFGVHPGVNKKGFFELFGDDSNYLRDMDDVATLSAYRAAKQARFEYVRAEQSRPADRQSGKCVTVTNKYGREVSLPPTQGNAGVRRITTILDACGIEYETEYKIDVKGCRQSPFDIALMKNGEPVALIEYDGDPHFDPEFFENTGVRPQRAMAHVVKSGIQEVKKTMIAAQFGIPLFRFNAMHMGVSLRDRLLAIVSFFVDGADRKTGAEVLMIDMLDEYGFDFPYIPPSDMSAAEKARVEKLYADRGIAFGTPIMDING